MLQAKHQNMGWALIILVLAIEVIGVVWVTWNSLMSVIADAQNPALDEYRSMVTTQGIALLLTMLLVSGWLLLTFIGAVKRRSWARSSHLTAQVLAIAAATGVFQGLLGDPLVGWALLGLGVLGLIATFLSRPAKEGQSHA